MTRSPHHLDADIRALGGIASAAELLDLGYSRDALRLWGDGRRSRRLRRGWYGLRDLPEEVAAAWTAGGALACVSALQHARRSRHHQGDPAHDLDHREPAHDHREPAHYHRDHEPDALHICVARTAARIPRTATIRGRPVPVVVHWSTIDSESGTRRSVAPATAARQAKRCGAAARRAGERRGTPD